MAYLEMQHHEMLRAEQIIRPTGLLDPKVEVRPVDGQIDDLIGEVNKEVEKGNKILITTLTKRMAEDLTDYMKDVGIRVRYLHSDIDTLERAEITACPVSYHRLISTSEVLHRHHHLILNRHHYYK